MRERELSFYVGTDIALVVQEAIWPMKTEQSQKADLLVISDEIFSTLSNSIQQQITFTC